jgi:hypothetical protein
MKMSRMGQGRKILNISHQFSAADFVGGPWPVKTR